MTLAISLICLAPTINASCKFEGKEICEGAVTKELSTVVKICVDGKLKIKKKSDYPAPWPKAGGGKNFVLRLWNYYFLCLECVWYGEVLCDGAVVQDLYRWWFLLKCSKNKMKVISRSWSEVASDPRYKPGKNQVWKNLMFTLDAIFIYFQLVLPE